MRYLFFVNPVAGKGKLQENICKRIDGFFARNGGEYRIHKTSFRGDAEKTARLEAQTGNEITMFACGGEGTCYEVLNGIVGYGNVRLGVIPCGSANDFLKFFGEKDAFCDIGRQINGSAVKTDIIKAGERYCLNGCSVGMDAMVANDMSIFKGWPLVSGSVAYKLAIVKNFVKKLGVRINISVDGDKAQEKNCLFAVIANAPFYGGGYNAAPDAVPFDGKLNFTLVDVISKLRVPKFLSAYQKGEQSKFDFCLLKDCQSMSFTSEKPIPVNLDGEIVRVNTMSFEILKGEINFLVPQGLDVKY